jgi:hypothetical protein
MIRKLQKAVGALLILGFLTPSLALADPTTVAVAPADASAASTASATAATTASSDVAQAGPLSDVPLNSWAYDAVDQLAKDGIIKGYPDGTFKGARPMTRYEAAVLAYRAVDMIEAQITAGKAVDAKLRSDIDAANKLIAAYGAELKAVERHVDALQTQTDAIQKVTVGQQAQINALNDFNRRAYIKYTAIMTSFAYGGNINANCGNQGPYGAAGNTGGVGLYCVNTGGGNALLQGVKTGGYQPATGNVPPSSNLANGQRNTGVAFYYQKLSFTGTPSPNIAFLVEIGNSSRPAQAGGTTTNTSAYCTPEGNYLNGNAAFPATVSGCSVVNAGGAQYNNGETGYLFSANNTWIQLQNPNSGLYLRTGHIQNNEGPTGGSWLGGDYFWGVMAGWTHGNFNGYFAYGVGDSANTDLALLGIPYPSQNITAEADYTFVITPKMNVNLGVMYNNYTGQGSLGWDPSAVVCNGPGGTYRFFANTTAVPFTSCGGGPAWTTPTYATGTPIEGYYLSPANNNPTYTGTTNVAQNTASATGAAYQTPGLAIGNPITQIGGHVILVDGNARLYLAGTMHLGNDPYTGTGYVGNLTGDFVFDYGPWRGGPGNKGHWTYEAQGFAVQFNGATPNTNYFGGPILDNSWTTNWNGLYWVEAAVKYWFSDNTYMALGYGHAGLLPNTILPAGNQSCPGCVVSGYTQNMGFLQMNVNF